MIKPYLLISNKKSQAYYISNNGNTNNSGLSSADPKTFDDISSLDFSVINTLKLNSNEIFDGQLSITDDIIIDSYGQGNKPKIRNSAAVTGFSDEGGNIYSKVMSQPEWVFNNGNIMKLSQTPWIETTATPSGTTITINHSDVSGYSNIIGSKLMFYKREYAFEDILTVVDYDDAGTITVDYAVTTPITEGEHIILMGKVDYFNGLNEWAYEDGSLYVFTSTFPTNIRYSSDNYIINVNATNVSINNIELAETFHCGIRIDPLAEGCTLEVNNCDINNIRTYGILNLGTDSDITLYNNEISYCGFCGFNTNIPCVNLNFTYNEIHHIACLDNPGTEDRIEDPMWGETGIYAVSRWGSSGIFARKIDNGIFSNNKIYNIGYCGIVVEGAYNTISYNIIYNYMLNFGDGGGVYLLGYNDNCSLCYPAIDNKIFSNIIYNAYGTTVFTPSSINGIYLDQGCTDTEIYSNVVYNIGINPSTTFGNLFTNTMVAGSYVHDNIFVGISSGNKSMIYLYNGGGVINPENTGNRFENNIFAIRKATGLSYCYRFDLFSAVNPFTDGYSDNNYFFNPYGTNIARRDSTIMTFAQLQSQYGEEANSTEKSNWLSYVSEAQALQDVKLYTNETDSDTTIIAPSGYEDIDGVDVSSQELTVPAHYGLLILKS